MVPEGQLCARATNGAITPATTSDRLVSMSSGSPHGRHGPPGQGRTLARDAAGAQPRARPPVGREPDGPAQLLSARFLRQIAAPWRAITRGPKGETARCP